MSGSVTCLPIPGCVIECKQDEFSCRPGHSECLHNATICDGKCDDLVDCCDETDCGVFTCEDGTTCDNSTVCYSEGEKCDGVADCTDLSDELGCSKCFIYSANIFDLADKFFPFLRGQESISLNFSNGFNS